MTTHTGIGCKAWAATLAISLGLGAAGQGAFATEADTGWEARRATCVGWMVAGAFPSGLEEKACRRDFALPSAFLFKCARAQTQGFESPVHRAACVQFFARASERAEQGYVLN